MTREYEVERESESKDILVLVLGHTGERGGEGGQTVGLEYVHMFDRRWGVGGYLDLAAGGLESRVLGEVFLQDLIEPLFFVVGPGFEWVDGDVQGLVRVGAGWEFEVAEKTIMGPSVSLLPGGRRASNT